MAVFLIGKSTFEIHEKLEGEEAHDEGGRAGISFAGVITQIVLLDLVFSLDSVITAVGMAEDITVMIIAVVVAVGIMLVSARAVSDFVNEHPTVKMLALAFLLLIGTTLVAEGLEFHIPKGYVYFAMGFSVFVEFLNLRARRRRRPPQPIELRPTSSRSARPPVRSVTSSSAATQRRGSTSQEGPRRPDDVDTQCTLAPARPASGGPVPPDGAAVGLHRRASAWWTGQRVSGVMARHRDRLPKGAS